MTIRGELRAFHPGEQEAFGEMLRAGLIEIVAVQLFPRGGYVIRGTTRPRKFSYRIDGLPSGRYEIRGRATGERDAGHQLAEVDAYLKVNRVDLLLD